MQSPYVDIPATARAALGCAEAVLSHWLPEGKRQGPEWIARNPTRHDDRPGSFSVNLASGQWSDFATGDKGGDLVSLIAYLEGHPTQGEAARRLAGWLGIETRVNGHERPQAAPASEPMPSYGPIPPEALASRPRAHPKHGTPSATWEYRDAAGRPLAFVLRFDPPGERKQFAPLTWTQAGGWQWKAPPEPRPLYGLDRLAARPEAPVLIAEGEKAADAAAELLPDLVCTTTMNGAQSPAKSDFGPLAGRRVLIWPDNDEPGAGYARKVAELAQAARARSVEVLDPGSLGADLPPRWDAADALADGWTPEDLAERVRWRPAEALEGPDPGAWPEPQPLPDGLAPVESFDYALLPGTLRPWVQDIAERVQCPPDYVGVASIAALATALGRKVGLRPQAETDWTVVGNQWALIIGRPGVLKSPAMEAALGPLKRLAALACELHETIIKDFERDRAVAKLRAAAAEKQAAKLLAKDPHAKVEHLLEREEIEEPALRRYIANDPTAAALGELLRVNPNGLLVHRDELVSLLKALDRDDNAEARGFYLTGWNGDSGYTFDRIIRGMNLHIPAVCLSLLGSTQPGRIASYIRQAVAGGAGDDGLIQRFGLLVWPDATGEWRDVDRWPNTEAKRQAFEAFQRLDQLVPGAVGAIQAEGFSGEPDGVPYLRLDGQGLGLFREWRQDLEAKLRGGELHPALESHLAKYRKLVPGLALLLHLAEGHTGPVGRPSVVKALGWAEYLETHARRAYGAVTAPEVDAAKAILFRLRKGDLKSPFGSRDVWRPGWASLGDRELVLDALRLLEDLDHLRMDRRETRTKTATVYTVNPRTL